MNNTIIMKKIYYHVSDKSKGSLWFKK